MSNQQKVLLSSVCLVAVIIMVVCLISYRSARLSLSEIRKEDNAVTESWRKINEDKIVIQKEIKSAKNDIRLAEDIISDVENMKTEITQLENEIEELKSGTVSDE